MLDIASAACKGGIRIFQLRAKGFTDVDFMQLAIALQPILRDCGAQLFINDNVVLARQLGDCHVHIGQSDMPYAEAREMLGPDMMVGLSVENVEDSIAANVFNLAYVAASPVFTTDTKRDTAAALGTDGLAQVVKASRHPVVAIGGQRFETMHSVMAAGASSIAVVSAICGADNVESTARAWVGEFRKLHNHYSGL
jgi:thiamine-phosphate pyrophosphorylase